MGTPKNLLTDAQHAAIDRMWQAMDGNAVLCHQSRTKGLTSGVFEVSSQEHLQEFADIAIGMNENPKDYSGANFPEMRVYIKADSNARVVALRLQTGVGFTEKLDVDYRNSDASLAVGPRARENTAGEASAGMAPLSQAMQTQSLGAYDSSGTRKRPFDLVDTSGRPPELPHLQTTSPMQQGLQAADSLQLKMKEINNAVPGSFSTKVGHYGAIFAANKARVATDPSAKLWSQDLMAKVAGLSQPDASRESFRLEPDSPRTAEIRAILDRTVTNAYESANDRHNRALDENDKRLPPKKLWPPKSMEKASGVPHHVATSKTRKKRQEQGFQAADSERLVIQEINDAVTGPFKTKADHYGAIFKAHKARAEADPSATPWPPLLMESAANIDQSLAARERFKLEPDTPKTTEVRKFLDRTVTNPYESKKDRHNRALDENDQQQKRWPTKSMRKASGVSDNVGKLMEEKKRKGL
jgi:hypothetical protein